MKKRLSLLLIISVISSGICCPVNADELVKPEDRGYIYDMDEAAAEHCDDIVEIENVLSDGELIDDGLVFDDVDSQNTENEEVLVDEAALMTESADENEHIFASAPSQNAVIDSRNYNFSKVKLSFASKEPVYYTGRACKPQIIVENKGKVKGILVEGTDYKIEYKNNLHAGSATAIVTGIGKYAYKGNVKKIKFKIKPKRIDKDKNNIRVSVSVNGNTEYKGRGIKPTLQVIDLDTGEKITSYNYKASYKNNKNVRTATQAKPPTVILTFRNDYRGKASTTFDITVAQLNIYNVSIKTADVKDTGKEITAKNIKTRIKFRDYTLKRGRDYDIIYQRDYNSYAQKFYVIFKGNFTGNAVGEFNIYK